MANFLPLCIHSFTSVYFLFAKLSLDFEQDHQALFKSPPQPHRSKSTPLSPIGSPLLSQTCKEVWHPGIITEEMLMSDSVLRQSTCLLEVDGIANDILNKNEVKGEYALFKYCYFHC